MSPVLGTELELATLPTNSNGTCRSSIAYSLPWLDDSFPSRNLHLGWSSQCRRWSKTSLTVLSLACCITHRLLDIHTFPSKTHHGPGTFATYYNLFIHFCLWSLSNIILVFCLHPSSLGSNLALVTGALSGVTFQHHVLLPADCALRHTHSILEILL